MTFEIRRAAAADLPGVVASNNALFAEDGAVRDRLRNADWPTHNAAPWIERAVNMPPPMSSVMLPQHAPVAAACPFH